MNTYTIEFDGAKPITLRETTAKSGNLFLAARPASETMVTRFGFNVDIATVGGKLPKGGKLRKDGEIVHVFKLEPGTNGRGNPAVSNKDAGKLEYDGVEQTLAVRISQPGPAKANVLIRTSRQAAAKVVDL